MKSSLIVENYSKSSKISLNRFTLFVESPYFNKNEYAKKLHYYLLKLHPNFDEAKCTKEKVFNKVLDGDFKLHKLKDLNSTLLNLFEQFLVNEALRKDKANFRRLEIQECFDNSLIRMSKKVINNAFKENLKLNISQSKKYYHNYIINDLAYTYQVYYGERKASAKYLQESINNLDKFYFTEKMLIGATIVNRKKILKTNFNSLFFDEISDLIQDNYSLFQNDDAIQITHQLYLLQKNDSYENYYDLKKILSNIQLNQTELRVYFAFLNNFCIRMVNSGKLEFLKELFELNILIIDKNLLLENGVLSEWSYKNKIALALRLKEFEWATTFIKTYSKSLPSKNYLNAYNYNIANVSYFKKDYGKALKLLLDVKYTDVFYILSSKALLLKIYYETQEFEALDHLLHSFRLLVMRQSKISTKQKNIYFNLIKMTLLLMKLENKRISLTSKKIKTEVDYILSKMEKMESIANKTWLLAQIKNF